jgi:hypothetical protein
VALCSPWRRTKPACHLSLNSCSRPHCWFPTPGQITGLMVALLFAGQHTSSITSTWTVLHLLHNPALLYVTTPPLRHTHTTTAGLRHSLRSHLLPASPPIALSHGCGPLLHSSSLCPIVQGPGD